MWIRYYKRVRFVFLRTIRNIREENNKKKIYLPVAMTTTRDDYEVALLIIRHIYTTRA